MSPKYCLDRAQLKFCSIIYVHSEEVCSSSVNASKQESKTPGVPSDQPNLSTNTNASLMISPPFLPPFRSAFSRSP